MMHDMRPSKHWDLQAEWNPTEGIQILLSMAACLPAGGRLRKVINNKDEKEEESSFRHSVLRCSALSLSDGTLQKGRMRKNHDRRRSKGLKTRSRDSAPAESEVSMAGKRNLVEDNVSSALTAPPMPLSDEHSTTASGGGSKPVLHRPRQGTGSKSGKQRVRGVPTVGHGPGAVDPTTVLSPMLSLFPSTNEQESTAAPPSASSMTSPPKIHKEYGRLDTSSLGHGSPDEKAAARNESGGGPRLEDLGDKGGRSTRSESLHLDTLPGLQSQLDASSAAQSKPRGSLTQEGAPAPSIPLPTPRETALTALMSSSQAPLSIEPQGGSQAATPAMSSSYAPSKDHHVQCGCCNFYPACLQRYGTVRCALLFLCMTSFLRSFTMNGVILVVLSTLERRYRLKGSESGSVVSTNDLASCIVMLPISFMASNRHKPRFVAFGIALMGIGNFVVSLAHFLAPPYNILPGREVTCPRVDTVPDIECSEENIRRYRYIMMIGQMFAGVGCTPINTVSIAYLDENLPQSKSAAYIGVFNSMSVFGPSVGFIFGGYTLKYFVDIGTDVRALRLTPQSSAWVGAWWICFAVSAAFSVALAVTLAMFPKHFPEYYELKEQGNEIQDVNALTVSAIQSHDFGQRLNDLPRALLRLVRNGSLIFLCLGMSFSQLYIIGITSIVSKFFEAQFAFTSTSVSMILGPVILVGGVGGAIGGGVLVSKLKLESPGIVRLCMCNCILSCIGVSTFWFYCPDHDVVINSDYSSMNNSKGSIYDLPCNHNCGCSEDVVDPVCSADNRMFLSPCYAGCQVQLYDGNTLAYAACACVNGSMPAAGLPVQAVPSRCPQKCAYLAVYVMGLFVCMTAVFLNVAPSTAATIRVVRPKERSLALGVRVIITRLFGTIPAPVVFGSIVDRSCQTWNHRCGEVGNCLAYQNGRMAHSLLLALLACMTASAICYTIAAFFVHRKSSSTAIKQYPEASYQE